MLGAAVQKVLRRTVVVSAMACESREGTRRLSSSASPAASLLVPNVPRAVRIVEVRGGLLVSLGAWSNGGLWRCLRTGTHTQAYRFLSPHLSHHALRSGRPP